MQKQKRPIPENFKEDYEAYLNKGMTLKELCKKCNSPHVKYIYRWRDQLKLPARQKSMVQKYKLPEGFREIYDSYLLNEITFREMAKKLGMPSGTLGDYIKRLKLPKKSKFLSLPEGDSPIKTYTVGNYHITIRFEKLK